jgi:3-methyl-2-oxobutanoate hydroxymethyltransferase
MRARPRAFVIVDMPFLSYQVSPERALESAGRIIKESGADAVKLEGGHRVAEAVKRIVEAGIPVCGHLGLTPQSVLAFGGYPLQGKGEEGERLLSEAKELEAAGCFLLVLEKVPAELAQRVTAALSIPTIGIGAGAQCDGQVLVVNDLLGLDPKFHPRFVKRYADLGRVISEAAARYAAEVRGGVFPAEEHAYHDRASAPASAAPEGSSPVASSVRPADSTSAGTAPPARPMPAPPDSASPAGSTPAAKRGPRGSDS